mmetsp:Transcript_21076/g.26051  ORF Transcript_21076/g.26051 Transcript_21076/m.26051 type:complete len:84 (-) Transcript_21076:43-294(-)
MAHMRSLYGGKVHIQVDKWFCHITPRCPTEIVPDREGYLVTHNPKDIMNVIWMQLSVAKSHASSIGDDGDDWSEVVIRACLDG